MTKDFRRSPLSLVLALAALSSAPVAQGGDDASKRTPLDPAYVAECGSCHVAYPPWLLPQASWRTLLAGLDRHFGTDASIDPTTRSRVLAYLERNAGSRAEPAKPNQPRITETDWFVREHRKVPDTAWRLSAVRSPSNCSACHTRAEAGSYREREIRLPK